MYYRWNLELKHLHKEIEVEGNYKANKTLCKVEKIQPGSDWRWR